jgi:N-acetylmuramoyl-L-alanine amidase
MLWSNMPPERSTRLLLQPRWLPVLALVCLSFSSPLLLGTPDHPQISVFSALANYSLPVTQHNGQDYVGLLELLDPLGNVTVSVDRSHWKLRYNTTDLEFTADKTRVKISGSDFDLPASFVLENNRGMIPLSAIPSLLPRILGGPVTFHAAGRRLFIGNAGIHFTAQIASTNPPKLVMNFSSSVNPSVHQGTGKLRLLFEHEPIAEPGSPVLTFGNPTIPSASYQEENGMAEISITGTSPLFASFSNENRTLTISTTPQPQTASTTPPNPAPVATSRHFFAVVDASHGGNERGAALNDQIAEKDVTLAFARRLRQELEARGLSTLVIRDGDMSLTLDQRASMVNALHPAVYICVHAASEGSGVRLYTALLPAAAESHGPFVDWNTAQAPFVANSRITESNIAIQLQKNQIPARSLQAALRPLNNVTTVAVALEITPQQNDIHNLLSPAYQQAVMSSVADGIAAAKSTLEGAR